MGDTPSEIRNSKPTLGPLPQNPLPDSPAAEIYRATLSCFICRCGSAYLIRPFANARPTQLIVTDWSEDLLPQVRDVLPYPQNRSTFWFCAIPALKITIITSKKTKKIKKKTKKKASSTQRASQAVPHPSTDRALRRLTSEFGRDPVYSSRYGR